LERIEKYENKINAFTVLFYESAIHEALCSDERRAAGNSLGLLDGVPFAVKDNIEVKDAVTSAGMVTRKNFLSKADAVAVSKLRKAGAVLLGKLNMHEAAFGATNENNLFGKTYNPYKEGYTPGGSSGGSAAAVSAGFCWVSLGTDTLGSVRIPASYCGVSGIKPTSGLVSTRGLVPLSWTLDNVGPLARTAKDLGLILDIISGYDNKCLDSRASPAPYDFSVLDLKNLSDLRIGYLRNLERYEVDNEVISAYEIACKELMNLGAEFEEIILPDFDFSQARKNGLLLVESEAAIVHKNDLIFRSQELSSELVSFLKYGENLSAKKLLFVKKNIKDSAKIFYEIFEKLDAIVLPTTPQTAFKFGKHYKNQADFTSLANLIKCPSVSVPMGMSKDGLPLGLQFLGNLWEDKKILSIASKYQENSESSFQLPNLI
tara:strand:+ start:941 stop:2236 length:1296 start_codon:yes stop_codon:yes gene_type:complete